MWCGGKSILSAFQNIGIFEREGFVVFSVLVVRFLIQEIRFILLPILLDFSHNIVQSDMASCGIVTHILLLVQGFQVLEDVVRCFGGADQEGARDVANDSFRSDYTSLHKHRFFHYPWNHKTRTRLVI